MFGLINNIKNDVIKKIIEDYFGKEYLANAVVSVITPPEDTPRHAWTCVVTHWTQYVNP